jgi:hypothetical protein
LNQTLAACFNRSITLSVIDEISCADGDISAFIVQSRRPSNIHPEVKTILRGAFAGAPAYVVQTGHSPARVRLLKRQLKSKDSGEARPFEWVRGKGHHFFRHLSENIRTQNASGA